MAANFQIFTFSLLLLISCFATPSISSTFTDENPIRLVSDGLQEIESSVVSLLGNTRHALSFARFIHRFVWLLFWLDWYWFKYDLLIDLIVFRHGKRYETVEEIINRFNVYRESLKLIRSTNKKGLPYKLHVNSKFYMIVSILLIKWNQFFIGNLLFL